jgi:inorganic phosphate transporter, PiT family
VIWIFLTGGLFLGWSLGANDAANVFGTAVGTGMVRFAKAAFLCSLFVIIGAVVQGSGGAATLNSLGSVGELHQAFILTLAAAITVTGMSVLGIPVSTSQAIVGAIIGWNIIAGLPTDSRVLSKILLTWVLCPLLAASFAIPLYALLRSYTRISRTHLLKQDAMIRWGLLVIGAFGSYSLGANNIANVMGVFIPAVNLQEIQILFFSVSGAQQLFFIGALAIAAGIFTFSRRTMNTVGGKLFKLTPESALIVVLSHSLVLFVFSSSSLSDFIAGFGLPRIPLVPVSSSQAIVGAIIGLGLAKGGYGINFKVLGEIGLGWLATPVISGLISMGLLYFWF